MLAAVPAFMLAILGIKFELNFVRLFAEHRKQVSDFVIFVYFSHMTPKEF
jgi:hypothetical protein